MDFIEVDNYTMDTDFDDYEKFIPKVKFGRVIKVFDGDTLWIGTILDNTLVKFSVRLTGIDTPEMRSRDEWERAMAEKARDKLEEMCMNQIVELKHLKYEKYGRLLAEVWCHNKNLGKEMLDCGLAVEYFGGKKDGWVNVVMSQKINKDGENRKGLLESHFEIPGSVTLCGQETEGT